MRIYIQARDDRKFTELPQIGSARFRALRSNIARRGGRGVRARVGARKPTAEETQGRVCGLAGQEMSNLGGSDDLNGASTESSLSTAVNAEAEPDTAAGARATGDVFEVDLVTFRELHEHGAASLLYIPPVTAVLMQGLALGRADTAAAATRAAAAAATAAAADGDGGRFGGGASSSSREIRDSEVTSPGVASRPLPASGEVREGDVDAVDVVVV